MHWRRKWQPTLVFLPGESHKVVENYFENTMLEDTIYKGGYFHLIINGAEEGKKTFLI